MLEIPIKFKEIKYPKTAGKTTGGLYTNALLKINDEALLFEHKNFKAIKYFFNQLPVRFDKNLNEPKQFYINKFGEYKIKYSNDLKNCEITFKFRNNPTKEVNTLIQKWLTKNNN